jgi:hypothetical protein
VQDGTKDGAFSHFANLPDPQKEFLKVLLGLIGGHGDYSLKGVKIDKVARMLQNPGYADVNVRAHFQCMVSVHKEGIKLFQGSGKLVNTANLFQATVVVYATVTMQNYS